ncbi:unnamed protein product [Durusdinium trenchii]|uniref:Glycosyltransferase family 92 protein n=1 Tax=Durusdinium trenchii TaxID=1381693 RepID=A0ABP0NRJ7_9DINO
MPWGTWSLAALAVALRLCPGAAEREELLLLQSKSSRTERTKSTWHSEWDLARIPGEQKIPLGEELELSFFSVVPTFGQDGNFIALLHFNSWKIAEYLKDEKHRLFCSGANRSHVTPLRVYGPRRNVSEEKHGLNFLCDWPAAEAHLERFEVFLEDATGKALGSVLAERKDGLLQQYRSAACVRDVFFNNESSFNHAYKMLPEWLEYSRLHGIEHFFMYTFGEVDPTMRHMLEVYLAKGWASRIHFERYPDTVERQHAIMEDCLYRAKGHVQWLLPSLDLDEFLRPGNATQLAQLWGSASVPQDYLRSVWDEIVRHEGKKTGKVRSISFDLYRYQRAPPNQLEMFSEKRSPLNGGSPLPKYAANVRKVQSLWVHWPQVYEESTLDLRVNKSILVANHYKSKKKDGKKTFPIFDSALRGDAVVVAERLRRRFGKDVAQLLEGLAATRPLASGSESSAGAVK